jgi:hypothetical protein
LLSYWGLLIWDPRELAISGDFELKGPRLPIEFSRISGDGRLTLVIDRLFGADCPTYVAQSAHGNINDAIESLRARERMPTVKPVGFMVARSSARGLTAGDRHAFAAKAIANWLQASGYDAAIWTGFESNFQQKCGESFSVETAIRYLETLNGSALNLTLNYIRRAPPQVCTPLRSAVNLRWPDE